MWNKRFVYVKSYFKIFKAVHEKKSIDALIATKQKNYVDNSCLLHSLYSHMVAETVTTLRLFSFTKKCVSGFLK